MPNELPTEADLIAAVDDAKRDQTEVWTDVAGTETAIEGVRKRKAESNARVNALLDHLRDIAVVSMSDVSRAATKLPTMTCEMEKIRDTIGNRVRELEDELKVTFEAQADEMRHFELLERLKAQAVVFDERFGKAKGELKMLRCVVGRRYRH
ncbi:hypothetical protein GALMADRAFT_142202 [Galerina marginata CBS 339.88]|uniref:Uncharacterized protein n=1 Tax=Galerina marginata (strain CBS 339.88) TaxID=685588 RepID=A0A067SS90_GALM3|nr:hypothetical protein GALMADRAFT_142202 [Galerina marginata CBS 339.88]